MSIGITLETNAPQIAKQLERALSVIRDGTKDPDIAAAFKRIGARLQGFERRRFLTLSRSGGSGEWPDLAISTKIRRLSKTKGQRAKLDNRVKGDKRPSRASLLREIAATVKLPILVDTGILINSLSTGNPDAIEQMLPDGVRIGSRVKYAAFHNSPTTPGRPPRRRIIAPPDGPTFEAIKQEATNGILRAMARRFNAGA